MGEPDDEHEWTREVAVVPAKRGEIEAGEWAGANLLYDPAGLFIAPRVVLPALETAHAVVEAMREAARRGPDEVVVVCFSGRGDKDCFEVARLQGEEIAPSLFRQRGLLMFWSHEPVAPWQTAAWVEQMRSQLRPNAFLRMIENRFVTIESSFVDPEWWAACEDVNARPVVADRNLAVWVGVDASVKRDSTAIVACTWDETAKKVRLVGHRVFQPSPSEPLDFEAAVEETLLALHQRFYLQQVHYDPYQLIAVAQRLQRAGVPMVEFPQSVPNLTEASTNLYDLIKGRNLVVYPDEGLRRAIHQAVALETSRGWRIAKEKQAHKIDVVVALAQAALGAVKGAHSGPGGLFEMYRRNHEARLRGEPLPFRL